MRDYKKPEVWKKSHEMYLYVKRNITLKLPKEERFELTSQLNRAALSVPLNIVEGCVRFTDKDFDHFLNNSLRSINETGYCSYAAFELSYISRIEYDPLNKLINEVRGMVVSFLKCLRNES